MQQTPGEMGWGERQRVTRCPPNLVLPTPDNPRLSSNPKAQWSPRLKSAVLEPSLVKGPQVLTLETFCSVSNPDTAASKFWALVQITKSLFVSISSSSVKSRKYLILIVPTPWVLK